jgi:2,4-dienoyl-CoA reductase-like NADH-dependent reductase (Old Yellow Enzyme family)
MCAHVPIQIAFSDDMRQPKEMTKQEIQDTIRAFVDAST